MALLISNAILHMVPNNGAGPLLSDVELDVDSETCYEFISKHVRRLLRAPAAKEATFRAESGTYAMVKDYQKGELRFKEFSRQLCRRLAEVVGKNEEIPSGDILIAAFDYAKNRYIAILKLPYTESITHRILDSDDGREMQLIKNTSSLPTSGNKITEACLIPYDPMVLRVLEKPCPVDGEMVDYFSQLFLECDTEMSRKETAETLAEIAEEVNEQFYQGDVEVAARIKCALVEEAAEEEDEALNLENAARRAFADRQEAADQFLEKAKEAGLPYEVPLDKPFVRREFKTQVIKADNGIEIKIPLEVSQNPEFVQIVTNSDGSLSVTLKNLRRQ